MPNAAWHEEQIRQVAGDQIEAMSATVVVPAMLNFEYGGQWITQQVQLIGIDEKTQSSVSDFGRYLQHPENRQAMSFQLREGGYDVRNHEAGPDAPERTQMATAGWEHRREMARIKQFQQQLSKPEQRETPADADAVRPIRSPAVRPRRTVRPGQAAAHRRGVGHRHGRLPHAHGRGQVPHRARRRREDRFLDGRPAAKDISRQLHRRRLLRKQDERVRRHVRLRADPQAARVARHDRPDHGRGPGQRHANQAQAGRRRRDGPRQAAGGFPRRIVSASKPGATSKARCWPPCKWRNGSSISCCS